MGLISALRRYSVWDKLTTIVTAVASAVPVFVLGFVLQYVFAVLPNKWGWPEWARLGPRASGLTRGRCSSSPRGDQWRYLILPAITLASVTTALAARMTRGSMLEVLRADYMRTARSKGLRERSVVMRHGLRNAMLPVITLIGIDFGTAIGVAVLTETTFSWPGLGSTDRPERPQPRPARPARAHPRRRARLRGDQPAGGPVVRVVRSTHPVGKEAQR